MAGDTPWGQQAHTYPAIEDRRMIARSAPVQQGVVPTTTDVIGTASEVAGSMPLRVKITGTARQLSVNAGDALIKGTHPGATRQGLYPVYDSGAVLTLDVGDANPRIDQIIIRLRDTEPAPGVAGDASSDVTIEILKGTATAGATLANRTGAAILPPSSMRLADVLVPAAHNAVFVQSTHVRDRRTHAYGVRIEHTYHGGDIPLSTTAVGLFALQAEASGDWPMEVMFDGVIASATPPAVISGGVRFDGNNNTLSEIGTPFILAYHQEPTGGGWTRMPHWRGMVRSGMVSGFHTYGAFFQLSAGTGSITARADFPMRIGLREMVGYSQGIDSRYGTNNGPNWGA